MGRATLPADAGMAFAFSEEHNGPFWMKDTLIPLSIAFVEPNNTIESIQEMAALDEQLHYAPRNYAYAIEANQGFFSAHGVAVGDTISLSTSS